MKYDLDWFSSVVLTLLASSAVCVPDRNRHCYFVTKWSGFMRIGIRFLISICITSSYTGNVSMNCADAEASPSLIMSFYLTTKHCVANASVHIHDHVAFPSKIKEKFFLHGHIIFQPKFSIQNNICAFCFIVILFSLL